ncbi:MAG: hypothetical protein HRU09_00065 [Oligoflexales bacterium]|nr:hypothetical protein [Oligoflexales bacterium]
MKDRFENAVQEILQDLPTINELTSAQLNEMLDDWKCEKIDGKYEDKRLGKNLIYKGGHHVILSGLIRMLNRDEPIFSPNQASCTPSVSSLAAIGKVSSAQARRLVKAMERSRILRRFSRADRGVTSTNAYKLTPVLYWEYCIFAICNKYGKERSDFKFEFYQEAINRLNAEKQQAIKLEDKAAESNINPHTILGTKGTLVRQLKKIEKEISEIPTPELLMERQSISAKIEEITIRYNLLNKREKTLFLGQRG